MISKFSSVIIACALLTSQVNTQANQNQQTVNQIVNAIKTSGISSGINEQHIHKVLGSNSLNTGKATINVINIVPKKKLGGNSNEIKTDNHESKNPFSQGLTMLSDTTNKENLLCNKPNPFLNTFEIQKQLKGCNSKLVLPGPAVIQSTPIAPLIQSIIVPNLLDKSCQQKRSDDEALDSLLVNSKTSFTPTLKQISKPVTSSITISKMKPIPYSSLKTQSVTKSSSSNCNKQSSLKNNCSTCSNNDDDSHTIKLFATIKKSKNDQSSSTQLTNSKGFFKSLFKNAPSLTSTSSSPRQKITISATSNTEPKIEFQRRYKKGTCQ